MENAFFCLNLRSYMFRLLKKIKRPHHADLFWVAIGIAFALIVFNQLLIQYMLYQKESDVRLINTYPAPPCSYRNYACPFSLFVLVGEFLFIYKPVLDQLYDQKQIIESENEQNLATKNKLLAILNSTSDANILIGLKFEILSINKTAERMLKKYFRKNAIEQQSILPFIVTADLESFRNHFANAVLGETTKVRKKLQFEEDSCWFELTYAPVYNDGGKIIGVSFNAKDIQVAQKRFEKLQEISWTHSHELRRPFPILWDSCKWWNGINWMMKTKNYFNILIPLQKI